MVPGDIISHYRVLKQIGEGGMGVVYLAEDTTLGRHVALKFVGAAQTDARAADRLVREAQAASALNHPAICTIYEVGSHDGAMFIAMEWAEGVTLDRRLQDEGPLATGPAIDVAIQVADALVAAHGAGIVHRDLKPGNMIVGPRGQVKVLDFGLARLVPGAGGLGSSSSATMLQPERLTTLGTAVGTIAYMSPEQARGEDVDARSDLFSFGVVLYLMTTGVLPFPGKTAATVFEGILARDPVPIAERLPLAPAELGRIVAKLLEKDVRFRYQTAVDLLADLQRLKRDLQRQTPAAATDDPAAAAGVAPGARASRRRLPVGPVTALMAAAVAVTATVWAIWSFTAQSPIDSIAVLPFVNTSGSPDADYLSEGLTEALVNGLSQLPNLRVVPRTVSAPYKGKDPQTAGRELKVRAVVTGQVSARGDTLNIQAELVDVTKVSLLWGDQYVRRMADVLDIRDDLSRKIAENLRVRLSGDDERLLVKRATSDTEAYQLYLKGRFYWNRRTEGSVEKAIEYLQQAIDKDPNFALAHAGLADCYNLLSFYGGTPTKDSFPRAIEAATRALSLDDSLAEAHASLAFARRWYDWDWEGAEREFKRSIQLNPRYATARHWYADMLVALWRNDEALVEAKRAVDLEPGSLIANADLGSVYFYARRYDEAIEQFKKLLAIDPNFQQAHYRLGWSYEQSGRFPEAIAELKTMVQLSNGHVEAIARLGHAYGLSGQPAEARKILAQLEDLSRRRYVSPFNFALVFAGLDDRPAALSMLEKGVGERALGLARLKVEAPFDRLRRDPRFEAILRRVRLAS
jgi:serine/threonine-protein kinase